MMVNDVGDPSNAWYSFAKSIYVVYERMLALLVWMRDAGGTSFYNCTIHIPFGGIMVAHWYALAYNDDGTPIVPNYEASFGEFRGAFLVT